MYSSNIMDVNIALINHAYLVLLMYIGDFYFYNELKLHRSKMKLILCKKNYHRGLVFKKVIFCKSKQKMNYVIVYIGVSTKDPLLLNKRSLYTIRPTYMYMALKFLYYFLDRLTGFQSLSCIMFLWTNLLLFNSKHIFLFFFHIIINLITLIKSIK